ncbi:helix-turn-helix domain-containing protein [Lactobacillus sp. PSON]|uniref:helix-turn-helix domain-containing protein n=1 Tax=Lactobacillus sp. PSON TaxID=3455454 RepID=UPI0040433474
MNRIRQLRKEKGYTLEQVAKSINVTNMTISRYERGEREPKIETWDKLASFFNVPTSYLMGLSNDKDGWDEWAKNTGYSVKQIKKEINRLKETGRLDPRTDIQHQIGEAVKSLDHFSYSTTQGVQHKLVFQLTNLINNVHNAFLEPQKNPFNINHIKVKDDMDEKTYEEIVNILTEAKQKIGEIKINNSN